MEQGSTEWIEFRKSHIGGSDISCIMGNNPWKDVYKLWQEKTGEKFPEFKNKAMIHGIEKEEEARNCYMSVTGVIVVPSIEISSEWEVAMASLDGINIDKSIICEIKCPLNEKLLKDAMDNKIPDHYMDQIQWQLWITGAERCDFFVYVDEFNYKLVTQYQDKKYQKKLISEAKTFWEYVMTKTKPPETGVFYVDDQFSNELANELKLWKKTEKDAKERAEFLGTQLKALHNENKKYVFTNAEVKMTWIEGKTTIDWKAYQKDNKISDEELEVYSKKTSKYATFIVD